MEYDAYSWRVASEHGGEVFSDCGVSVDTHKLSFETNVPNGRGRVIALVPGGSAGKDLSAKAAAWIRRAIVEGTEIAGIGEGAMLLAELGILERKQCSVHWEMFPAAVERFLGVTISHAYHSTSGAIHTCAGGASAFDLFLQIMASDFGSALSNQVNEAALNGEPRGRADKQPLARQRRLQRIGSPLLSAIVFMEQKIGEPLLMSDLKRLTSLSRRQIERLFIKHLGEAPMRHYARIRLERANSLLRHAAIPIVEVSVASGFSSHSHFTKVYRRIYGATPLKARLAALAEARPQFQDHKDSNFQLAAA